jgi:transposase
MTVSARPKTPTEWRQVITRWEQSKLSIPAFATQIGMSSSAVWYWKKRFEREASLQTSALGKASSPSTFVPVTLVAEPKPEPSVSGARRGPFFELLLPDGRIVRIPPDFESASLVRLLSLLRDPSC